MHSNRQALFLLGLGASVFAVAACGAGSSSDNGSGSGGGSMDLVQVSNGFGQLLPHTVLQLDASGNPTGTAIPIRTTADLLANHTQTNPILPVVQYPVTATLPSGGRGNHFMYAQFTADVDITSILDSSPANQQNGGVIGSITLVALDPEARVAQEIPCRIFLDGKTYAGTPTQDDPDHLPLQQWVSVDPNTGQVVALPVDGAFPGLGFPGTPGYEFSGASALISPRTVVFVADSDNDLNNTLETFPEGREIEMRITTSVRSTGGRALERRALAATTVGQDTLRPVVSTAPPPLTVPIIIPGDGQTDVDPTTSIHIEFSEPVQPISIGTLPNGLPPVDPAVIISFGPPAQQVQMPYTCLPTSVFDLSAYDITPGFNFPGEGPSGLQCGIFNAVTIHVAAPDKFKDLASPANTNLIGADTNFTTGEGPGVVNAPVTPDTIYVGRSGAVPGLSVIDLNGFGQGTGDPTFNSLHPVEGNTNFPNNPNLRLQGAQVRPPLEPGLCTINGGSAGVFTLARDSSLNDLLVRAPLLTSIGDTMIGHGLDSTFNNGPSPFGCQSGGGNLCAQDAKKIINPTINGNGMIPTGLGQVNGTISAGAEDLVCWGPHPNPPALFFPPLCVSPFIGGQEPTSIDTTLAPPILPGGPGLTNLLGPGDPFGNPLVTPPIPPTGLLAPEQNQYFEGPSLPNAIQLCQPYMMRQQIGHFLYVIDRARREIVVLNSNRMTVIDRIPTQDPTTLGMSPNLNLLAVVNQTANLVSFIDIDPHSSTFHQVVQETSVGERPRGVAWEPGNEDILVCNESESTLSVISAATLQVRKVVRSQLNGPFDIAITPRQLGFGYQRYVYFGYVLNRTGRVAVFESGPNTVNGWGYDDIIGIVQPIFQNPKAIQPDHVDLRSAVWIAHEGPIDANGNSGPLGVPALSKLVIDSATSGAQILNNSTTAQFRDMHLGVQVSIGPPQLSGIPVDIAFDNMRNWTGLPNYQTPFSVGAALPINGKQLVRVTALTGYHATNTPRYMFAAVPNPFVGTGVVDVIRIDQSYVRVDTNPFIGGIQSIPVDNCQIVTDYLRQ